LDRFSADSGLRIWYSNGQKAKRRILGLVCKEMGIQMEHVFP